MLQGLVVDNDITNSVADNDKKERVLMTSLVIMSPKLDYLPGTMLQSFSNSTVCVNNNMIQSLVMHGLC